MPAAPRPPWIVRVLALLTLLFVGAPLAAPSPAHAAPEDAIGAHDVEVALVHATRGDPHVGKGLGGFARDLKALPFQRFERVDGARLRSPSGDTASADLEAGVVVRVQVSPRGDDRVALEVVVTRAGKRVAGTTVVRPIGRAYVVDAGKHQGAVLLVAVRATR